MGYLIEFRFFGKAKYELKSLIHEVKQKFRIRTRHRDVAHITLAGPFQTRNQRKLVSDFKQLCMQYDTTEKMGFEVEGYGTFDDSRVVFVNIEPNELMDSFRWELAQTLKPYCKLQSYDKNRKFYYHATIAKKLPSKKFKDIKNYIHSKPKPHYKHLLMRVTLLKDSKILYEYDFFLNKLLNRREAKSRHVLSQSFDRLKQHLEAQGLSVGEEKIPTQDLDNVIKRKGPFGLFGRTKVFFIADLHLDHKNIIKYCNRPFSNVKEMNKTLVKNWNDKIGKEDIVFFLGDLAYGRGSKSTDYWFRRLNGHITFFRGNHDKSRRIRFYDKLILKYKDYQFLLVHDPKEVPADWDGWVIHGHTHNNKPEYPFINTEKKTINVGVENTDYNPVELKELLKAIKA